MIVNKRASSARPGCSWRATSTSSSARCACSSPTVPPAIGCARGEIPPEPPPLSDAFGCRPTLDIIGPHAVICLAGDRLSIRDAGGRWDQWRIEGWRREDTTLRVIWVVSVVDGTTLWLTLVPDPEPSSPRSTLGPPAPGYHVVGSRGLLHSMLGARDSMAEDELHTLPAVERPSLHQRPARRPSRPVMPDGPSPPTITSRAGSTRPCPRSAAPCRAMTAGPPSRSPPRAPGSLNTVVLGRPAQW